MTFCRKIYDTLSNTTDPSAQVEVAALGFSVQCGEVPPNNYTIDIGSISGGFHIAVSANMGGRTVGLYLSPLPSALHLAIFSHRCITGVSGNISFDFQNETLRAYFTEFEM